MGIRSIIHKMTAPSHYGESPSGPVKLILIINNGLKMGKGKIAAQAGHASVQATLKAGEKNPLALQAWLSSGQKKVCLKGDDADQLLAFEKQAKEAGYELKVGKFPFSASGKASAAGTKEGFVKVIFDAKYGEWLGCHMIGAGVTDMIAEAVLGRKLETTGHEVLKTIHPHPTMSEAVMEAVADAYGEVIHL